MIKEQITKLIDALGAETATDSISPTRMADLLRRMLNAVEEVAKEEVANLSIVLARASSGQVTTVQSQAAASVAVMNEGEHFSPVSTEAQNADEQEQ